MAQVRSQKQTVGQSLAVLRGTDRGILATRLEVAESFLARSKGLLGRTNLPLGEALWIKRCNSIHTFFMKFPIDAIFVDDKLKIVAMYRSLKPWRITRLHLKASSVFEFPAETLAQAKLGMADLRPGDQLKLTSEGKEEHG